MHWNKSFIFSFFFYMGFFIKSHLSGTYCITMGHSIWIPAKQMRSHWWRSSYHINTSPCCGPSITVQYCADRSTLTETAVVGEVSQEVVTFLFVAPAGWAGAPWSHAGCRIVHVVGSNCTTWRHNACKSQSLLNINSPLELLHCVLNALLSEWI